MICKKCGNVLNDTDQFCTNCGAPRAIATESQSETPIIQMPEGYVSTNESMKDETPVVDNIESTPIIETPKEETIIEHIPSVPLEDMGTVNMNENSVVPETPSLDNAPLSNIGTDNPEMNTVVNEPVSNPEVKKGPSTKGLIIALIAVIIIAAAAIIAVLLLKDDSPKGTDNKPSDGPVATVNTYTTVFNGYSFQVPSDMQVEKTNEDMYIFNMTKTWGANLQISPASFELLKTGKSAFKTNFEAQGFVSSDASIKTIGGLEFITVEVDNHAIKQIFAVAKINDSVVIPLVVRNFETYDYDYSTLEKIAPIIKSATISTSTNNVEFGKLDLNFLKEMAQ